jgi:hypothetical protein
MPNALCHADMIFFDPDNGLEVVAHRFFKWPDEIKAICHFKD